MLMLEQRIQQQFFESADLQYQTAESLSRPLVQAAAARLDPAGEALPEPFVERRVVGFPDAVAGLELAEVDVVVREVEPPAENLVDASALLGYTGALFRRAFGSLLGPAIALTALSLWCVLPVFLARRRFLQRDF